LGNFDFFFENPLRILIRLHTLLVYFLPVPYSPGLLSCSSRLPWSPLFRFHTLLVCSLPVPHSPDLLSSGFRFSWSPLFWLHTLLVSSVPVSHSPGYLSSSSTFSWSALFRFQTVLVTSLPVLDSPGLTSSGSRLSWSFQFQIRSCWFQICGIRRSWSWCQSYLLFFLVPVTVSPFCFHAPDALGLDFFRSLFLDLDTPGLTQTCLAPLGNQTPISLVREICVCKTNALTRYTTVTVGLQTAF
jgi:hypothetical protein